MRACVFRANFSADLASFIGPMNVLYFDLAKNQQNKGFCGD